MFMVVNGGANTSGGENKNKIQRIRGLRISNGKAPSNLLFVL